MITRHAGQLLFTTAIGDSTIIDNIQFSSSIAPEPDGFAVNSQTRHPPVLALRSIPAISNDFQPDMTPIKRDLVMRIDEETNLTQAYTVIQKPPDCLAEALRG